MANGRLEARITVPTGGWAVSASENAGDRTSNAISVAAAAAEYYLSSPGTVASTDMLKALEDALNNDGTLTNVYTVSLSTTTGKVTISATGDNFAITWDDDDFRDLLGWDGNISETGKTYTSDNHAEALWLPDGDWQTEFGDVAGWIESDKHDLESASGYGWSYQGSKRYVNSIFWPAVGRAKTLAGKETTENESFEVFWRDGILGEQNWATTGGPIRWYPDTSAVDDATYFTYRCHGLSTFRPSALQENWVGQYSITLPRLVQDPSEYPAVGESVSVADPIDTIQEIAAAADPAQELITLMGYGTKPTYLWFGNEASGATEVISGGTGNLTDTGTPQKQQTDHSALGATTQTTQFISTGDGMDAGGTTIMDVGAETVVILYVIEVTTTTGTQYIMGKRESTGSNIGHEVQHVSGGTMSWICDSASGVASRAVSGHSANTAITGLAVRRGASANEQYHYTAAGNATGGRFNETLTNAVTFTLGDGRLGAHPHHVAMVAAWVGSAGDTIDNTHRLAFAQAVGYE